MAPIEGYLKTTARSDRVSKSPNRSRSAASRSAFVIMSSDVFLRPDWSRAWRTLGRLGCLQKSNTLNCTMKVETMS